MFTYLHVIRLYWCGPAFFNVRPHSMGETRFLFLLENHLKETVWSRHLFCFILKGENKIRKKP